MSLGLRAFGVLAAVLLPAVAWACPSCAGREGGGPLRLLLVGAMIAAPFVVAVVVGLVLRKQLGGEDSP